MNGSLRVPKPDEIRCDACADTFNKAGVKKVLEFGSGPGWNLLPFKNNGYEVAGVELSRGLVEVGQQHGMNVKQGSFDEIEGVYDAIICNHVVEHFTDFIGQMQQLLSHLRPEGFFYGAVPDKKLFGIGQMQNAHVYNFTQPTFHHYMQKCGLKFLEGGPAQEIHQYGLFQKTEVDRFEDLSGEYSRMSKTIKKVKRREFAGKFIDSIGVGNGLRKLRSKVL